MRWGVGGWGEATFISLRGGAGATVNFVKPLLTILLGIAIVVIGVPLSFYLGAVACWLIGVNVMYGYLVGIAFCLLFIVASPFLIRALKRREEEKKMSCSAEGST